jgi:hypothetical protein
MFDLETWGTRPGCAIRSVGAVMFDPYSDEMGAEFYCNVSDESCVMAGLFVQDETAEWWEKQSQEAQDALAMDQQGIYVVVQMFHQWFRKNHGVFLWAQGSNFDEVIWSAIAHKLGQRPPWKFFDVRDTRTAYDLANFNHYSVKRSGTYHNALDDAKHQAICVSRAYAKVHGEVTGIDV